MASGVPESVPLSLTRMWVDGLVADTGYSYACFDGVAADSVLVVVAALMMLLLQHVVAVPSGLLLLFLLLLLVS